MCLIYTTPDCTGDLNRYLSQQDKLFKSGEIEQDRVDDLKSKLTNQDISVEIHESNAALDDAAVEIICMALAGKIDQKRVNEIASKAAEMLAFSLIEKHQA